MAMLILGIDTSCDDTSAALIEASDQGVRVIRSIVSGQDAIHTRFGGIVPELASRCHIESIWDVAAEAIADVSLGEIGAVAVCHGPGLIGSLLVGCAFAKSLAYASGVPLVGVNHLEGHVLTPFLGEGERPRFPYLSLVVSGGHTSLYRVEDFCAYEEIGRTRDDAAGEAYDKVSKLLGLGYPGGPALDRLAREGSPEAVDIPRAYLPGSMDFSFSGMKTAMRIQLQRKDRPPDADLAASFQAAVVDVLVRKTEWAMEKYGIRGVSISGGVAANSVLREKMRAMAEAREASLFVPPAQYCTDNAAMIALAGYRRFVRGERAGLDLNPSAHLPLR